MSTFAQETDNDLTLTRGQLVLVTDVAEEAAIELGNKFRFVRGEWFLDVRQGTPFFQFVFVKNPDILLIQRLFRSIILGVQGVDRIIDMTLTFDSKARRLDFTFRALAADGRIITGGAGKPFIVEP